MSRNAEINLRVDLDEQDRPTRIEWDATEAQDAGPKSCQSMMLSLWDNEAQTTVAIDLWTRDTTIDDMNLHFYQVIHKLADTYQRATNNAELAERIHEFGREFGDAVGLVSNASTTGQGDAAA
jgi:gliding motility-associated protein GldC